jgi:hypothetical protein
MKLILSAHAARQSESQVYFIVIKLHPFGRESREVEIHVNKYTFHKYLYDDLERINYSRNYKPFHFDDRRNLSVKVFNYDFKIRLNECVEDGIYEIYPIISKGFLAFPNAESRLNALKQNMKSWIDALASQN